MKQIFLLPISLLLLNACSLNLEKQAKATTNEILLSIKNDDETKFKDLFLLKEDAFFDTFNKLYHDSIMINWKENKYPIKDTVLVLGNNITSIKCMYVKIPYHEYGKNKEGAFSKINLYIYFNKENQKDFNKAYSYEFEGIE